jgi:excisionase family DNA binding protein
MEHLMTSEEVAEILHVDPVTIRRLVGKGELAAYRIGSDYRFASSDLEKYLERQRIQPAQANMPSEPEKTDAQPAREEQAQTCSQCSTVSPANFRYCHNCGHQLIPEEPESSKEA